MKYVKKCDTCDREKCKTLDTCARGRKETAYLHLLVLQNRWKRGIKEKEGILVAIGLKKYSPKSTFFIIKRRVVLSKTTARFTKNDGSFPYEEKQMQKLLQYFFPCPPPYFALPQDFTRHRSYKIAQTSPICAEINLIIRNKTLTLPNLLRDFMGVLPYVH